MAITKMKNIKTSKGDYKYRHLARAIPYACNPLKTRGGILAGAYNCLPEIAFKQMIMTKERFGKTDKDYYDEVSVATKKRVMDEARKKKVMMSPNSRQPGKKKGKR